MGSEAGTGERLLAAGDLQGAPMLVKRPLVGGVRSLGDRTDDPSLAQRRGPSRTPPA